MSDNTVTETPQNVSVETSPLYTVEHSIDFGALPFDTKKAFWEGE